MTLIKDSNLSESVLVPEVDDRMTMTSQRSKSNIKHQSASNIKVFSLSFVAPSTPQRDKTLMSAFSDHQYHRQCSSSHIDVVDNKSHIIQAKVKAHIILLDWIDSTSLHGLYSFIHPSLV